MEFCLEFGGLLLALRDGLDEGEHFVGGLREDEGGDGFLAYGETDGEVAETGEGVGS